MFIIENPPKIYTRPAEITEFDELAFKQVMDKIRDEFNRSRGDKKFSKPFEMIAYIDVTERVQNAVGHLGLNKGIDDYSKLISKRIKGKIEKNKQVNKYDSHIKIVQDKKGRDRVIKTVLFIVRPAENGAHGSATFNRVNLYVPKYIDNFNEGRFESLFYHEIGHTKDPFNNIYWMYSPARAKEKMGSFSRFSFLESSVLYDTYYRRIKRDKKTGSKRKKMEGWASFWSEAIANLSAYDKAFSKYKDQIQLMINESKSTDGVTNLDKLIERISIDILGRSYGDILSRYRTKGLDVKWLDKALELMEENKSANRVNVGKTKYYQGNSRDILLVFFITKMVEDSQMKHKKYQWFYSLSAVNEIQKFLKDKLNIDMSFDKAQALLRFSVKSLKKTKGITISKFKSDYKNLNKAIATYKINLERRHLTGMDISKVPSKETIEKDFYISTIKGNKKIVSDFKKSWNQVIDENKDDISKQLSKPKVTLEGGKRVSAFYYTDMEYKELKRLKSFVTDIYPQYMGEIYQLLVKHGYDLKTFIPVRNEAITEPFLTNLTNKLKVYINALSMLIGFSKKPIFTIDVTNVLIIKMDLRFFDDREAEWRKSFANTYFETLYNFLSVVSKTLRESNISFELYLTIERPKWFIPKGKTSMDMAVHSVPNEFILIDDRWIYNTEQYRVQYEGYDYILKHYEEEAVENKPDLKYLKAKREFYKSFNKKERVIMSALNERFQYIANRS